VKNNVLGHGISQEKRREKHEEELTRCLRSNCCYGNGLLGSIFFIGWLAVDFNYLIIISHQHCCIIMEFVLLKGGFKGTCTVS